MGKEMSKALIELARSMRERTRREQAQRASRRRNAAPANDPYAGVISPHTAQHGDYHRHNGRVLNRGGTALDRWRRDGQLTDTQQAAILHCQRLWEATDTSSRLVANLDRTVFGTTGEGNVAEIEARSDLYRIQDYFRFPLDKYWHVFEAVCRFDEPAGKAGSRLSSNSRAAIDAARLCVCMVADIIATKERLSY